jgi:hypothetical protein
MSGLGEGVKADLDGMTDYAGNLDKIHNNFMSLGRTATGSMQDDSSAAFSAENNGLVMTSSMAEVVGNNIKELTAFLGQMTQGVLNVAMAAQTVANTYGDTDATNAARLNGIDFAFGDKSAAPDTVPPEVLKQLKSWNDVVKENPALALNVPAEGVTGAVTTTDGNVKTTTMKVDGHDYKIVTTTVSYPGLTVITAQTYVDGSLVTTRATNYGPQGTRTTESHTTYADGKPTTRVVSDTNATTTFPSSTTTQHNESTTTYTYDEKGKQTGTTTSSSTQVGDEHLPDTSDPLQNDPAQQKRNEIAPPPKPDPDEVILAPGAPGQTYSPGGTATA